MAFSGMKFDLSSRSIELESNSSHKRNETIKFSDLVSRMKYKQGDNYYIELIVKHFDNPLREIDYGNSDYFRDIDAARLELILGNYV